MSVALFIVPERKVEGFDHFVNGKFIGRESDRAVDRLCKELGVTSLYEFCSQDPQELADFIEGEGGEIPDHLPALEWFEATSGLKTVRAMLQALEKGAPAFKDTQGVIGDLKEYEVVLSRLEAAGIRWHMQVDF